MAILSSFPMKYLYSRGSEKVDPPPPTFLQVPIFQSPLWLRQEIRPLTMLSHTVSRTQCAVLGTDLYWWLRQKVSHINSTTNKGREQNHTYTPERVDN